MSGSRHGGCKLQGYDNPFKNGAFEKETDKNPSRCLEGGAAACDGKHLSQSAHVSAALWDKSVKQPCRGGFLFLLYLFSC